MMNVEQINAALATLQRACATGSTVKFTKGANDLESYVEPGMRATITSVSWDGEGKNESEAVFKLRVDFSKFDEENKQFETHCYFDKNHNPVLSAREAGQYEVQDTLYLSPDFETYFTMEIDSPFREEFVKSGSNDTYVKFLEDRLTAALAAK
jgi:hypothetical protein